MFEGSVDPARFRKVSWKTSEEASVVCKLVSRREPSCNRVRKASSCDLDRDREGVLDGKGWPARHGKQAARNGKKDEKG